MKEVNGIFLPDYEQEMVKFLTYEPAMIDGKGTYQRSKWERAIGLCKQRRTAVDIGAHVGLWSMPLARHFDRVEAFEPLPGHADCWERNLEGAGNAVLHMAALGDKLGSVMMSTEDRSSGDTHVVEAGAGEMVPLMRLDEYALQDVDLMKLDCEGYELLALRGGKETLMRCKPVVVVEQKPQHADRYGFEPLAACRFLEGLGARLLGEIVGDYYLAWP